MRFAYPEFLYAFLVLTVPIIIHLFNFRRYKTLYFSSLQFLKKIDEDTKSIKQIKHWVILAMRLLAFSALALAFAQPYIPGKTAAKSGQSAVMAFYLDNSFSMSAMGVNGNLLNQGKEAVRKLVDKAPPGTNFQLVTNNLSGKESRMVRKSELLDRIDRIDFSPQSRTLRHVLNFTTTSLNEQGHEGNRQYILLSDFQKQTSNFNQIKADSLGIYYPFQLLPQSYDNLFIDSIWFETPLRKVNVTNELHVRVVNTGDSDFTNVPLSLSVGEINREIFIDVPAASADVFTLTYTDRENGIKSGKVEIADNQLYFDDAFYFSYIIKDQIKVLLINGKNAYKDARLVFETDPFFRIASMDAQQIQFDEIAKNDLIVLNELDEIPSALVAKLLDKLNAGGSVCIIPSEEAEVGSYNNLMGQLTLPLFTPAQENKRRLTTLNYDAPFFTGMFEQRKQQLNLPNMLRVYDPQVTVKSDFTPLISFEDNTPFFLQSNQTNAFVFYGSTAAEFGNLSRHGIFAATLLRIAGLSQSYNELYTTLDEESAYKLGATEERNPRVHLIADGLDYLPQVITKGAATVILIDQELLGKLHAGNYLVQIEGETVDIISLNYGREESIYEVYTESEITDSLQKAGVENIQINTLEDFRDIEQLSLSKPIEYWRILLILGLLFFLTEMLLVKIWKL